MRGDQERRDGRVDVLDHRDPRSSLTASNARSVPGPVRARPNSAGEPCSASASPDSNRRMRLSVPRACSSVIRNADERNGVGDVAGQHALVVAIAESLDQVHHEPRRAAVHEIRDHMHDARTLPRCRCRQAHLVRRHLGGGRLLHLLRLANQWAQQFLGSQRQDHASGQAGRPQQGRRGERPGKEGGAQLEPARLLQGLRFGDGLLVAPLRVVQQRAGAGSLLPGGRQFLAHLAQVAMLLPQHSRQLRRLVRDGRRDAGDAGWQAPVRGSEAHAASARLGELPARLVQRPPAPGAAETAGEAPLSRDRRGCEARWPPRGARIRAWR